MCSGQRAPWPVGLLAQAAAMEALRDPEYYAACYARTHELREGQCQRLKWLNPVELDVNFFLVRPEHPAALAEALRQQRIFVREFPAGPLAGSYLRITVKDEEQNQRICAGIARA
jgi:histidinol-phosphate/aromatic aminotransferase/cobyric acid decarboxylase-like protein